MISSGDLTCCHPNLVRELSWCFIGLKLEQIKPQDNVIIQFSIVIYFNYFYRLHMVLWYYTNLPKYPIIVNFLKTFTFASSMHYQRSVGISAKYTENRKGFYYVRKKKKEDQDKFLYFKVEVFVLLLRAGCASSPSSPSNRSNKRTRNLALFILC